MIEKLGPCPLCGGNDVLRHNLDLIQCSSLKCRLPPLFIEVWSQLSTLAAQNKRRGEALQACREWFWEATQDEYHDATEGWMMNMCEEALK